ncbi:LysR family transcriptional regulator [Spirillospora sp. NPDC048819]|uniref:LysR family transcriptional regulator n=1 Tax=Spirillospora sp. NPDC048819 TaxID=3155268 RepID=UPI00340EC541
MELRVLRYFLAVVDAGSVTKAAAEVHVAQPSLSRQLRGLETSLGMTLFDRTGKRMRLTAAGLRFLPIARDLVTRADTARAAAAAIAGGQVTRLTVAAPATTITDVIAPFLAGCGPDDPIVMVEEESPTRAYRALARGADVAISSGPPRRRFAWRPVARLPLWAYVHPGHRWAARSEVAIGELSLEPLVVLTVDHGSRRLLDEAALAAGVSFDVVFECATPQVAQAMAASSHGIAVVSDDPRFGLKPLIINGTAGPLQIHLHAAWDRTHYAAPAIEWLVRGLTAFCVERYGPQARG